MTDYIHECGCTFVSVEGLGTTTGERVSSCRRHGGTTGPDNRYLGSLTVEEFRGILSQTLYDEALKMRIGFGK